MLKILIKFESIYIIVIYLFYRVDFNTLSCNWFRWENVLGDAKKDKIVQIQFCVFVLGPKAFLKE